MDQQAEVTEAWVLKILNLRAWEAYWDSLPNRLWFPTGRGWASYPDDSKP